MFEIQHRRWGRGWLTRPKWSGHNYVSLKQQRARFPLSFAVFLPNNLSHTDVTMITLMRTRERYASPLAEAQSMSAGADHLPMPFLTMHTSVRASAREEATPRRAWLRSCAHRRNSCVHTIAADGTPAHSIHRPCVVTCCFSFGVCGYEMAGSFSCGRMSRLLTHGSGSQRS